MKETKRKKAGGNGVMKVIVIIAVLALGALAAIGVYLRRGGGFSFGKENEKIVVVLDAGHDQSQPGNVGLIKENEYAEQFCTKLEELLKEDSSRFTVIRTHGSEEDASLETRQAKLNETEADVVISIHALYDPFETERTPRLVVNQPDSENYKKSVDLAKQLQKELKDEGIDATIGSYTLNNTHGDLYALTFTPMDQANETGGEKRAMLESEKTPVVIVEIVNVNNAEDVEQLASEEGIARSAKCIYDALRK